MSKLAFKNNCFLKKATWFLLSIIEVDKPKYLGEYIIKVIIKVTMFESTH